MNGNRIKLIVFDLDGTVLDTLGDLAVSLNASRIKAGLPAQSVEFLKTTVGNGLRKCLERSTEGENADIDAMISFFGEYYTEHCTDNTFEYEGMTDVLKSLKDMGIKLAVYTNKPHVPAVKLIDARFPGIFDIVEGHREGNKVKPDPGILNDIMERVGAGREETLYVGDSEVDIMTADNARVQSVSVTWGFKTPEFLLEHGAKVLIDRPDQLLGLLSGQRGKDEVSGSR